ncbi:MAG: Mth938-like domain-containing protein [Pseudomonadota bacterium]
MEVSPVDYPAGRPVDGYGPGFFRLGDTRHDGPLALFVDGPAAWAGLPDIAPFTARAADIDVLLIGTGAEIAALAPDVRAGLESAGIGVEQMATPPACRTYNVLLGEGRRVALAAMPV